MNLVPKQIWKEEFNYYSEESASDLKSDIQELFYKTEGWNFSVNLTGSFTSEFEFKMTPKWQNIYIKNYESSESYLNGRIYTDDLNRTLVTFSVRPNSIFLILFYAFPIMGLFGLATVKIDGNIVEVVLAGLASVIAVPKALLMFGRSTKQRIKNRFIETFKLKPVD